MKIRLIVNASFWLFAYMLCSPITLPADPLVNSSLVRVKDLADELRSNVLRNGCVVESIRFLDRFTAIHPTENTIVKAFEIQASRDSESLYHAVAVFSLENSIYYYDMFIGVTKTPFSLNEGYADQEFDSWLKADLVQQWRNIAQASRRGFRTQSDLLNVMYGTTPSDNRKTAEAAARILSNYAAQPVTFTHEKRDYVGIFFVYRGAIMVYMPEFGTLSGGKLTKAVNGEIKVSSQIDDAINKSPIRGAKKRMGF